MTEERSTREITGFFYNNKGTEIKDWLFAAETRSPSDGTKPSAEEHFFITEDNNMDNTAGKGKTTETAAKETTVATATAAAAAAASTGSTAAGAKNAATRSAKMNALDKKLREEIKKKKGTWSLYMYRFDTGEEIAINANVQMISASLIKLYIAGCYLERVYKAGISDKYDRQLFKMLSESDNASANTLIDFLTRDTVNRFISNHGFKASKLNRKMLQKNGTENYTSAADCGRVLRQVYKWVYVNARSSGRVMKALCEQIARNRQKIPAGVPSGIETANKTGELFTNDKKGVSVDVQNDAAIIFAPEHPYVLVVMSAVPSVGEAQLRKEIATLSSEVYKAICG